MKFLRIFFKSLAALFLAIVTLWIAALVVLQTTPAQKWLLNTSLDFIEKQTGTQVEMGDIELVFPLTIRISKLSFLQNKEKLVTVDKVIATCTYGALLEGRILFSSLHADGIHLIKKPLIADSLTLPNSSSLSQPWDGKTFPFYIKIENLFLNNITIDPSLIEQLQLSQPLSEAVAHSKLSIKGFISNNPFRRGITSHLNIAVEDEAHSSHPINLILHTQRKILRLSLDGNHLPQNVKDLLSVDSKFEAAVTAPITTWLGVFNGQVSSQERLEGWFKFALKPLETHYPSFLTELTFVEGTFALGKDKSFILKEGSIKNNFFELIGHAELQDFLTIRDCQFKGSIKGIDKMHPHLAHDAQLSFEGILADSIKNPSLTLNMHSSAIQYKDQILTDINALLMSKPVGNIREGTLQIDFDFSQRPFQISSLFNLDADKLAISQLQVEGLDSSLTGQLALFWPNKTEDKNTPAWPFTLEMAGFWNENWTARAIGDWQSHENETTLHLSQLSGNLGPYPFQLLAPLTYHQEHENVHIDSLAIQISDAILKGSLHKQNENVSGQFLTSPIPTELFHFIDPYFPLTGRLSLSASLDGTLKDPRGQLQLLLHHVQFTEQIFEQKPFIEGTVDLSLHHNSLSVQSSLNGIGNTPVLLNGTFPFLIKLDPVEFKVSPDLPFSLNLQAEGELDPYLHLFYNDISNLSGQTKIALNLSGQMNNPLIQGTVDLYNGSFESLDTGAIYNNIQAHLEGQGQKVLLTHFIAHDNKDGTISATGEISLEKNHDFPFDFKIHPSRIFVLESDYANLSVSGPLTLSGNRRKAILKGELTSDDATIHLEQALPKQIKHIDIQYINEHEGEQHLTAIKKQNDFVELDIQLTLPNKVMIEGKNLTSEWKGNVAVTGTPVDPLFNGDIRVVKGEYNLNGKVFNLTQGNIHFAGAPSKKTSLYIIAGKDIDNIHAEIIVKGPVNKPVLSFRSNPPLSQREVLSYILFNRGIADITQDQGDQLSQSFIELNESDQSGKSSDLLGRLRNNIGIDRLDITSSDSTNKDVSLQVGKYITDNVFISINKSISDIGNRVAIEANLRKNLKAEAEVELGGETQGKVSLKWKKDY